MDEKRVAYLKHEAQIEADEYNRKKSDEADRIAALEEALRPFAALIDYTDEAEPDTRKARIPIEIRHIRFAAALLEDK